MPINPIVLQRRHAELGRIRLGNQVATTRRDGTAGTRPNKLDKFRFTSASEQHVRDLAEIYGGTPQPWDNNGKPEWEVYTTAKSIPVIVVKGGLSQWMETWSGGGCVHRCDGVTQQKPNAGQLCDPNDPKHTEAKPYTRLSVMLPELAAIGVWRMESHGWNAAAEIPAIAELAQFVGDLVPAELHLMERRVVKDGQTSRFVVPVLDLRIGSDRLKEIVAEKSGLALPAGQTPGLQGSSAAALPAGSSTSPADDVVLPTIDDIEAAVSVDVVFNIHRFLTAHEALTPALDVACKARRAHLEARAAEADPDGAWAAEVVDPASDPAATAIWNLVLDRTGQLGMSLDDTNTAFEDFSGGVSSMVASADQLQAFLETLGSTA